MIPFYTDYNENSILKRVYQGPLSDKTVLICLLILKGGPSIIKGGHWFLEVDLESLRWTSGLYRLSYSSVLIL